MSSDIAILVAQSQERIGALDARIGALHNRQDAVEKEIKAALKELTVEMKSINEYINKQKGQKAVLVAIGAFVGGLIGKFLIK